MELDWRISELWSRIRDLCDLEECDSMIQFQLKTVGQLLLGNFQSPASTESLTLAHDEAIATAEALLVLSNEKLSSYVYKEVPTHWRQLHTDAILIKVSTIIALRSRSLPQSEGVDWLEMIKLLDLALIISGAPGKGRRSAIYFLIHSIQNNHLVFNLDGEQMVRSHKKPRISHDLSDSASSSVTQPIVVNPIPEYTKAPSAEAFSQSSHKSPFVIRGYCKDWKALSSNSWKNLDYLKAVAGPGRVVPVEIGKNYTEEDWSQAILSWDEFLDKMNDCNPGQLFYLAQYNIFNQFVKLKDDIELPEYLYCDLPPMTRQKPEVEEGVILNFWLGPASTVSPAHVDPYYNCYAQIAGRKYVWVANSKFTVEMYPFGLAPGDKGKADDRQTIQTNYMTNTSQVDVLDSIDKDRVEYLRENFPDFVDKVMPEASQTILEEGDMLIIPSGWWHSMKSLEPSINLSMWF